jgi:hypothetical protein
MLRQRLKFADTDAEMREERLQIMLAHDELTVVDTFRFSHRMLSRAAADQSLTVGRL